MVGLRLKMSVFLLTYQDDWAQTTKGGWGVFKPQNYYSLIQNIELLIIFKFLFHICFFLDIAEYRVYNIPIIF